MRAEKLMKEAAGTLADIAAAAREEGAAVAFGIMGMAEAIRRSHVAIHEPYGDYDVGYAAGYTDAKWETYEQDEELHLSSNLRSDD